MEDQMKRTQSTQRAAAEATDRDDQLVDDWSNR
jgi:hypothetical protein